MSIITLTSDWSNNDYYVGAVKGRILSLCPGQIIVDISHTIPPFNTSLAAFVIRNAYRNFPEGTIHLIFVNTEVSDKRPALIVKANDQYFIGIDNGIFSLILADNFQEIIKLDHNRFVDVSDIEFFTSVASCLVNGSETGILGEKVDAFSQRIPLRPTIDDKNLTGSVIYIDSYQNAITNITKDLFERVGQGRKFEIFVQSKHYRLTRISKHYGEAPPGELVALFNSVGLMEIAINNGNAAGLLNLDMNSTVRVEFSTK